MTNFAVSTEPADGLALFGAMISAGEVQTLYMYIYMSGTCDSSRNSALHMALNIALTLIGQYMAADASVTHVGRPSTAMALTI